MSAPGPNGRQVKRLPSWVESSGCCAGAWPYTFIFEKPRNEPATPEQLADWSRREKIVRENGGVMLGSRWEIGAKIPAFTAEECRQIVEAVAAEHPDLVVKETWNGIGCHTFSVGAKINGGAA